MRLKIHIMIGAVSLLVIFVSLLSLPLAGNVRATATMLPESEDTFEFTNNEAEDAYDLHIHWSRAVTVKQVKPFKKKEGSGTSRTDFSNGVVKRTGKASVTVSWDGSTDAKVEEWWWTKKGGDRLGEEKKGNPTAATSSGLSGAGKASLATANGLYIITVDNVSGRVIVSLPDDMRAGDTISGTVVAEPKGNTNDERKVNAEKLGELKVNLGAKIPVDKKELMILLTPRVIIQDEEGWAAPSQNRANFTTTVPETFDYKIGINAPRTDTETVTITVNSPIWFINNQSTTTTQPPSTASPFSIPELSQQGRPVEIFGPFDGNRSNTTLFLGLPLSPPGKVERTPRFTNVRAEVAGILAESPRKMVFESPTNFTGPVQLMLKEGETKALAPYRNVGVVLSAPKTNLMRGERTTVMIEVRGLEGIQKDVPLQLDSKGVITMEGGNFQNLRIKPSEVTPEGRYITNRAITGVQAGGFSVTATVIVRRFDFSLQDDTDPNRLFHFNSFTGDYVFACGGGSCRPGGFSGGTQAAGTTGKPGGTTQPGGTVQPGGTTTPPGGTEPPLIVPPTGVNLTGIGKPTMKGCIITLSHNAPDRRVFARLDACTKTGDASVQTNSPKTDIKITDKNTADNTAASPPPK